MDDDSEDVNLSNFKNKTNDNQSGKITSNFVSTGSANSFLKQPLLKEGNDSLISSLASSISNQDRQLSPNTLASTAAALAAAAAATAETNSAINQLAQLMAAAGAAQGQQQMILQATLAQQLQQVASKTPVNSGLSSFSFSPAEVQQLQQQLQQHQQNIQNLQQLLLFQSTGQLAPNLQALLFQNQVNLHALDLVSKLN